MKTITIKLNDDAVVKLDAIREKYSLSFLSEAAKLAISFAFDKEFPLIQTPAMTILPKSSAGRPALSDEAIRHPAKTPEDKKRIREQARRDELIGIACAQYPHGLNGVLLPDGKSIQYYTYFERGRDERTLLLREVNKDLIQVQYQPSYDEIKRMQEEGKVDYPIT